MGRLRKKPWADEYLANSLFVINEPSSYNGIWKNEYFKNENEIWVEIGMGKGGFTIKQAINNPNVNILGVEKYPSVQVIPLKNVEESNVSNLKFVSGDAIHINEWFNDGEVDKIFINFPDPWPKERHAKRRLLYKDFLNNFYNVLKPGGWIEFKTDQNPLFDFALEQANEHTKFLVQDVTRNLHKDNKEVIMTEYEKKFSSQGNKINFMKMLKEDK